MVPWSQGRRNSLVLLLLSSLLQMYVHVSVSVSVFTLICLGFPNRFVSSVNPHFSCWCTLYWLYFALGLVIGTLFTSNYSVYDSSLSPDVRSKMSLCPYIIPSDFCSQSTGWRRVGSYQKWTPLDLWIHLVSPCCQMVPCHHDLFC